MRCLFTKIAVITTLFLFGCAHYVSAKDAPKRARAVNCVLAVVNGEVITQHDVEQLLGILYAQYGQDYKGEELLKKMEDARKEILGKMIEDKLILSRAKELEIKVSEQEVDDRLEYIKSGFTSEEKFYDTLKTQGITVDDLKKRYTDQILMKKVIDFEVRSKISVMPSEITEYYKKHREDFKVDERRRVRHILIKAKDDVESELARVEIEDIYKRLKSGEDFASLARGRSEGPNREEGGDMGFIRKGEMLPELDKVIFSLKPGEFSEPVKSNVGYHIFKVEEVSNSGYKGIDKVKSEIRARLFKQKLRKRLKQWIDELKANSYIEIKQPLS